MMDFNKLFSQEDVDLILSKNHDISCKEVGDRVNIIDFSSCTFLNGRPLDYDLEDDEMVFNFNTELIVIATGQHSIYDADYTKYKQNLVVVNTLTNKQFRISSGHVTLR